MYSLYLHLFIDKLDKKVMLERNYQRIQEIQEHMVWPSITDIDQKAYIPEVITRYKNIYP